MIVSFYDKKRWVTQTFCDKCRVLVFETSEPYHITKEEKARSFVDKRPIPKVRVNEVDHTCNCD